MKTRDEVRAFIVELTAMQLDVSADQITDETSVPDMQLLILDATRGLCMKARIADIQHFSTVGDAIKAFCPGLTGKTPAPFIDVFDW